MEELFIKIRRKQIKPPALRDFAFTDHMNLLIPTGSEGWFGLYAPSPVRSVFYQQ